MLRKIDKPTGYTSHDIVDKVRRLVGRWIKVGHSGTLDPLATGMLLIATHKDTKRLHHLQWLDKVYTATVDLSSMSDTRDTDYYENITHYSYDKEKKTISINETDLPQPTRTSIEKHLTLLNPWTILPLPYFNAKKIKWKKMYEYAREWTFIDVDVPMDILSIEVLSYEFPYLMIRTHVGSGTYIRSIAYWIGKQCGTWWIISALRRDSISSYTLPHLAP